MLLLLIGLLVISKYATAIKKTELLKFIDSTLSQRQVFTRDQIKQYQQQPDVSYVKDVKPILDSRCVVCHGCYDAPCQLKLSSYEGLDRGATKTLVYDPERYSKIEPTRLFIDAKNKQEWRDKEFFPVIDENGDTQTSRLNNSVLARLLKLKQDNPSAQSGKLSDDFDLDIERDLQCPAPDEISGFEQEHPMWGMPYAMPALTNEEENTLFTWLQQGAKLSPRPPLSAKAQLEIKKWESFFNGASAKQQLVSRYIYEHLYIGHLHFHNHPANEFYQLIRSKTPQGQTIDEINTARPYEDPGVAQFYYRLRPVVSTIVDKNHFVYELSDQRLQRYQKLFYHPDYAVAKLPGYAAHTAANPFKTFIQLPLKSRYQFLLDDAQYFFSGFIKGPVCRGQIAINAIQDHFWVAFINPDLNFTDKVAGFLAEHTNVLNMPGSSGDDIGLFDWKQYGKLGHEYLKVKDQFINQSLPGQHGFNLNSIWDGGGFNRNASLTVFRHFDNATVLKGFVGDIPSTGWLVDYPVFERIHYLLVAGFDVFGSVKHQVAIRNYMDYLRMDAENNFLRFIPSGQRHALRDTWYQGLDAKLFDYFREPFFSIEHETDIIYKTGDYKKELFTLIKQKLGNASPWQDDINRCKTGTCNDSHVSQQQQEIIKYFRTIASFTGKQTQNLPEVSFIRVETDQPDNDPAYTLIVNRALSNLSFMYGEKLRRVPERDTITVVPGFVGSYPNFFFSVKQSKLAEFVDLLGNARSDKELGMLYGQFGVRRSNPKIWPLTDWFNAKHLRDNGLYSGLFDINRYKNL